MSLLPYAWAKSQRILLRPGEAGLLLTVCPSTPGWSISEVQRQFGQSRLEQVRDDELDGLLASAYPRLHIDNRAKDGATFEGVVEQLAGDERYDLVLIQAGGNDVIRLRSEEDMRADIDRALQLARARSERVLVMPAGNVGNAPFFIAPASWYMTSRARTLHALVRESAQHHGAVYINLFKEAANDPFAQQPGLHAVDGLHPSDAGYRLWFDELMAQGGLGEVLAPAR